MTAFVIKEFKLSRATNKIADKLGDDNLLMLLSTILRTATPDKDGFLYFTSTMCSYSAFKTLKSIYDVLISTIKKGLAQYPDPNLAHYNTGFFQHQPAAGKKERNMEKSHILPRVVNNTIFVDYHDDAPCQWLFKAFNGPLDTFMFKPFDLWVNSIKVHNGQTFMLVDLCDSAALSVNYERRLIEIVIKKIAPNLKKFSSLEKFIIFNCWIPNAKLVLNPVFAAKVPFNYYAKLYREIPGSRGLNLTLLQRFLDRKSSDQKHLVILLLSSLFNVTNTTFVGACTPAFCNKLITKRRAGATTQLLLTSTKLIPFVQQEILDIVNIVVVYKTRK